MVSHPSLVSFVLRAKNRKKVLFLLERESMYSGRIGKETGMYKSHTSRALRELEDKGLIKCKNPKDRAYRFYSLTPLGKNVLKGIKKA
ncbi:MAG: winged helix-turn-helix domain-containing protein [archaeon]